MDSYDDKGGPAWQPPGAGITGRPPAAGAAAQPP
ncbi:hypothetical protein GA0115259_108613, partial [Streptomyces sp. MnatMP-M17]